jgi:H+-translocating NAD(P) transhydrogenase subunit alpha
MQIGVRQKTAEGEARVAVTLETARRRADRCSTRKVHSGAGAQSVHSALALGRQAFPALCSPLTDEMPPMQPGSVPAGRSNPFGRDGLRVTAGLSDVAAAWLTARAKRMDGHSTEAVFTGGRASIFAAEKHQRRAPMLMAAAGGGTSVPNT